MEFSFTVAIVAVVLNVMFLSFLRIIQQRDFIHGNIQERDSLIPGTNQKFLYLQDFYSIKFGVTIGLSVVAVVLGHLWNSGFITGQMWFFGGLFGSAIAIIFGVRCLFAKTHKPDWGYPKVGIMSLGGLLNLIYIAQFIMITIIIIWNFVVGNLNVNELLFIIAVVGYSIFSGFMLIDWFTGNFATLKKS